MENKDILDQQIECAIRERAAINHFKDLESKERVPARWAAAASIAALLCVGGIGAKESMDARSAAESYLQGDICSDEGVRDAFIPWNQKTIEEMREELERQRENPSYSDPEYDEQLDFEEQSLVFREALEYMKKGRFLSARKALKAIVAGKGIYSADAAELLKIM